MIWIGLSGRSHRIGVFLPNLKKAAKKCSDISEILVCLWGGAKYLEYSVLILRFNMVLKIQIIRIDGMGKRSS